MKMSNLLVLLAALCLLGACSKGRTGSETMDKTEEVSMQSADSVSVNSNAVKLVKTAEMQFKVKDVQKSSEAITALTRNYKGIVMHHDMKSTVVQEQSIRLSKDSLKQVSAYQTTANITVKVPPDNLDQFMNEVSHLGIHVSVRRMDIEDKTLDYLSAKLKHENRLEIASEQKKWKPSLKEADAMLQIKDETVDQKINNSRIDEAVRYSVVDMSLYQSNSIIKEIIANDDPGVYQIPFLNRLLIAFQNGWEIFASLVIALTNLWVFILAGWGIWLLFKLYKRKVPTALNSI
ncbi:DUF4349 domain-containing protein [Mucilaginibacter terrae]|uniref:DUF4349 domain-containing protein n=1 Tax=Mucilaginibacter terrae TaxID=1955052 RepID=UPI00363E87EF